MREHSSLLSADSLWKLLERAPTILVVVAAYFSAQLTWQAYSLSSPLQLDHDVVFNVPAYEENLLPNSQWRWSDYINMYEAPKKKAAPAEIKINVVLTGLIQNGDESLAMLQIDKGAAGIYVVNDPLKDGVSLAEIRSDGVVLRKGGLTRFIPLVAAKSDLFVAIRTEERKQEVINREPPDVSRGGDNSFEEITVARLPQREQQEIARFQKKATEKPLDVLKDVNINEVKENDTLLGYSIQYNINPALLRALGLLPTDVILEVNNIPVSQIRRQPGLVASLLTTKNFTVLLRRNGALKTLNIIL